MSSISINSINNQPARWGFVWPNIQTAITSGSILTNFIAEAAEFSSSQTIAINSGIRLASLATAIYRNDSSKVIFDLVAFATIFCPYGRIMNVVIDFLSEVTNLYQNTNPIYEKQVQQSIPPKSSFSKCEACDYLGIEANQKNNKEMIQKKYDEQKNIFLKKIADTRLPKLFRENFQIILQNIETAYLTLTQKENP